MGNGGWVLKFWAAAADLSDFQTVFGGMSGIWAGVCGVPIATGGGFRYTAVQTGKHRTRGRFLSIAFCRRIWYTF